MFHTFLTAISCIDCELLLSPISGLLFAVAVDFASRVASIYQARKSCCTDCENSGQEAQLLLR